MSRRSAKTANRSVVPACISQAPVTEKAAWAYRR